ncbi:MAG: PDZ domain-containing protein [Dokdonella sp.]|uniref:PDZ domain-containing protein n=1 Tax=Dokdonella sp. TaxID=2291710 RepID=UPI003266A6E3
MKAQLVLSALLLLSGCATVQRSGVIQPAAADRRYEIESGRDATMVAEMRAAPVTAPAEITLGRNPTGDAARLAAQGFVKIGTGHTPGAESDARDEAMKRALVVGAEKVLLYPPEATDNGPTNALGGDWIALYFVRFKLPFGATFRDLRPQERAQGGDNVKSGGIAIGSVIGGTPASRANLRAGDIVIAVDGKSIADRTSFQSMLKASAGRSVKLTLVRNGETLVRVVKLGTMREAG